MEQIEQLKAMRDAAKARLEAMPDFRLMNSLGSLIDDLEDAFGLKPVADVPAAAVVASEPAPEAVNEEAPAFAVEAAPELQEIIPSEPALETSNEIEAVAHESADGAIAGDPEVAFDSDDLAAAIGQEMSDETLLDAMETVEAVEVVEMVETLEFAPAQTAAAAVEAPLAEANGNSESFHAAETEEDAVSRALDELSADLAEVGGPADTQPSVLTFPNN